MHLGCHCPQEHLSDMIDGLAILWFVLVVLRLGLDRPTSCLVPVPIVRGAVVAAPEPKNRVTQETLYRGLQHPA